MFLSYINALANTTTGGGYENEKYYTQCKISFLNIENIHAVRDSFNTSTENITEESNLEVESGKWLEHIRLILDGVLKVVYHIDRNYSVHIHCSDGWDRTSQVGLLFYVVMLKNMKPLFSFKK